MREESLADVVSWISYKMSSIGKWRLFYCYICSSHEIKGKNPVKSNMNITITDLNSRKMQISNISKKIIVLVQMLYLKYACDKYNFVVQSFWKKRPKVPYLKTFASISI